MTAFWPAGNKMKLLMKPLPNVYAEVLEADADLVSNLMAQSSTSPEGISPLGKAVLHLCGDHAQAYCSSG